MNVAVTVSKINFSHTDRFDKNSLRFLHMNSRASHIHTTRGEESLGTFRLTTVRYQWAATERAVHCVEMQILNCVNTLPLSLIYRIY